MKKRLSAVLLCCMLALCAAACAHKKNEPEPSSAVAPSVSEPSSAGAQTPGRTQAPSEGRPASPQGQPRPLPLHNLLRRHQAAPQGRSSSEIRRTTVQPRRFLYRIPESRRLRSPQQADSTRRPFPLHYPLTTDIRSTIRRTAPIRRRTAKNMKGRFRLKRAQEAPDRLPKA